MKNKELLIVLAVIGIIALVGAVAFGGFFLAGHAFPGRLSRCGQGYTFRGRSSGCGLWNTFPMMGGGGMWGRSGQSWSGQQWTDSSSSQILTIEEVESAISEYTANYGSDEELHIGEIMIFDNHAYAEVIEEETGIGAFEVLVDPETLAVFPEIGPNMMWNLKYGHMRSGMMGDGYTGSGVDMPISGEDAIRIANEYLRGNKSGLTASSDADPFYGYYTIHTLKDDHVDGMLSVNGYDGEIFLHTWHGDFIEMTGHADNHAE